ncbi:hypothetical protein [Kitasatospora sp. NPDC058218]|uniref:hypothetical protein n=1 Tax=Kitasatospora sp. NPDC058218 TaxID=3346385 RepID=UPI0036DA2E0F
MDELDWKRIDEIALKVAKEMALKWPIVEADDVRQEIMLHVVEQAALVAKKADDEEFIRRLAWRVAKAHASKEQNYRDLVDDQYYYTPDEVRNTLRSFIYTDDEVSSMLGKKDDLSKCRISDNITSARLDASAGLKKLTDQYREVLMRLYIYGLPARSDGELRTGYRAVDALAIAMNSHIRTGR